MDFGRFAILRRLAVLPTPTPQLTDGQLVDSNGKTNTAITNEPLATILISGIYTVQLLSTFYPETTLMTYLADHNCTTNNMRCFLIRLSEREMFKRLFCKYVTCYHWRCKPNNIEYINNMFTNMRNIFYVNINRE